MEDVQLAACAPSCTRKVALSQKNPRRFSPNRWAGLMSSSGPPAMKKIHENSRCISSPHFRVWRAVAFGDTT